jgi:hypothetical protein
MALRILQYLSGAGWVPYSRIVKENEFKAAYELYTDIFKDHERVPYQVASSLGMQNLLQLHLVFKERMTGDRERKICGFFVINLLSETGLNNVVLGKKDGRHFDSSDMVAEPVFAKAIYIGAMGGRLTLDKAYVMSEILRYSRDLPNIRLFGRPSTQDGKRIAKKYGWRPLKDKNNIDLEVWEGQKPYE